LRAIDFYCVRLPACGTSNRFKTIRELIRELIRSVLNHAASRKLITMLKYADSVRLESSNSPLPRVQLFSNYVLLEVIAISGTSLASYQRNICYLHELTT